MTKRRVRRKVRTPAKPVVEDVEEQEVAEEEETEDAPAPKPAARRTRRKRTPTKPVVEEEVEEKPKPTRRRRKAKPAPEPEPEVEEEELEEEETEDVPKPRRRRRKAKAAPEPEVEEVDEEYLEDDTEFSVTTTGNELADAMIAACDAGKTVVIQKVRNKYNVSTATGVPAVVVAETTPSGRPKYALTKKELEAIGLTQGYKEFMPSWTKMTWEEKMDRAEDEGVDVNKILATYDDALVLNIYLTKAIHEKLGIVKWEDGFEKPSQRKQIRITGVIPD